MMKNVLKNTRNSKLKSKLLKLTRKIKMGFEKNKKRLEKKEKK
jgi:hypothetical protein